MSFGRRLFAQTVAETPSGEATTSDARALYRLAAGRKAPACFLITWRWWIRGFRGFTLGPLVFLHPQATAAVAVHEMVHVRQFYRYGGPLMWFAYVVLLFRDGYRRNTFELEARAIAERALQLGDALRRRDDQGSPRSFHKQSPTP